MPPTKTKRLQYEEENMEAACESVRKGKSVRESSRTHGVPYATLHARLLGRTPMRKTHRTVLNSAQESKLVEWLSESRRRGFGRKKEQLKTAVQHVLNDSNVTTLFKNNKPGETWFRLFSARHKDNISSRTSQALGSHRASVTESKILFWFRQAEAEIDAVDPDVLNHAERIFNCDESGFQLSGGMAKVLAPKHDKRVYQVTNDTHKQITVLVCGSAACHMQMPLLIFPGKRFSYFGKCLCWLW